jgi:hypothetical protein
MAGTKCAWPKAHFPLVLVFSIRQGLKWDRSMWQKLIHERRNIWKQQDFATLHKATLLGCWYWLGVIVIIYRLCVHFGVEPCAQPMHPNYLTKSLLVSCTLSWKAKACLLSLYFYWPMIVRGQPCLTTPMASWGFLCKRNDTAGELFFFCWLKALYMVSYTWWPNW